jgi:hypothetical protein
MKYHDYFRRGAIFSLFHGQKKPRWGRDIDFSLQCFYNLEEIDRKE